MRTASKIVLTAAAPAVLILGLSIDASIVTSARAQMPLEGCNEAPIPERVDGASYYKCDNGQYFRDFGGQFVEVDEQGRRIQDPNANQAEPEPETATVEPPSESVAEPEFQNARDPASGEAATHFKKVPQ